MTEFTVRPLTPENWPALEALFGRAGAHTRYLAPVDTDVPGHTRNTFTGTAAAFARRGFQVVARRKADRPIMRLSL